MLNLNEKLNAKALISVVLFLLFFVVIGAFLREDDKTEKYIPELYKKIIEYQIEHNSQLIGMVNNIGVFDDFYAPHCPMVAPIIYYSLNPKAKFGGIMVKQGYHVAYFTLDKTYIAFGYIDKNIMFPEKYPSKITPIYDISYENKEITENMTEEQITNKIVKDICQPMNEILGKYKNLPVSEIIAKMQKEFWNVDKIDYQALIEQIPDYARKFIGTKLSNTDLFPQAKSPEFQMLLKQEITEFSTTFYWGNMSNIPYPIPLPEQTVNFTPEGVKFVYYTGEIAANSVGPIYFFIPYERIKPFLIKTN